MGKWLWGLVLLVMLSSACVEGRVASPPPFGGSCFIRGRTLNCRMEPLAGVRISVTGPGSEERWKTVSDSSGAYSIPGLLERRKYKIVFRHRGNQLTVKRVIDLFNCDPCTEVKMDVPLCGEKPLFEDYGPSIDRGASGGGAVVEINPRTGEPEPHAR